MLRTPQPEGLQIVSQRDSVESDPVASLTVMAEFETMRALRFHQTGSLDELQLEEVPTPVPILVS
jgi:hypothetical protein